MISDCCGANVYDDIDICSACKEHCEPQEEEEEEEEDCCMARSVGFPEDCHCIRDKSMSEEEADARHDDFLEGKHEEEKLNNE